MYPSGSGSTGLIGTVLDFTCFNLGDGLREIHRNRTQFRVRHEAARAEDLTKTTDSAHHVRRSDSDIEVEPATLDLLDDFIGADEVCACSLGFLYFFAFCKDEDALGFTRAVWQDQCAADLLVSVFRINAETDMQLDGLIELLRSRLS